MPTPDAPGPPLDLSPRAREILAAARELLEQEGYDGLTMRHLGQRIGIRAQSLYEHFPDKHAIENALVTEVLWECGERMFAIASTAEDPLMAMCDAHRAWAREHPHLYRLGWSGRLDLEDAAVAAAEQHSGAALVQATGGDRRVSRSVFSFIHGMIVLELNDRLPVGTDTDELWRFGLEAIRSRK